MARNSPLKIWQLLLWTFILSSPGGFSSQVNIFKDKPLNQIMAEEIKELTAS